MPPDDGVRQRGLVDRPLVFGGEERLTRYVFPFVDRRWRVPFVVVDFPDSPPKLIEGPFRFDRFRYRTPTRVSELRSIESVALDDFRSLIHFDPWWVFRGVSGVASAWAQAVFATNIAHPFQHAGRTYKIQDLVFSQLLDRLDGIDAKGGMFRSVTFRPGDLDLLALRPAPKGTSAGRMVRTAKAL